MLKNVTCSKLKNENCFYQTRKYDFQQYWISRVSQRLPTARKGDPKKFLTGMTGSWGEKRAENISRRIRIFYLLRFVCDHFGKFRLFLELANLNLPKRIFIWDVNFSELGKTMDLLGSILSSMDKPPSVSDKQKELIKSGYIMKYGFGEFYINYNFLQSERKSTRIVKRRRLRNWKNSRNR